MSGAHADIFEEHTAKNRPSVCCMIQSQIFHRGVLFGSGKSDAFVADAGILLSVGGGLKRDAQIRGLKHSCDLELQDSVKYGRGVLTFVATLEVALKKHLKKLHDTNGHAASSILVLPPCLNR